MVFIIIIVLVFLFVAFSVVFILLPLFNKLNSLKKLFCFEVISLKMLLFSNSAYSFNSLLNSSKSLTSARFFKSFNIFSALCSEQSCFLSACSLTQLVYNSLRAFVFSPSPRETDSSLVAPLKSSPK